LKGYEFEERNEQITNAEERGTLGIWESDSKLNRKVKNGGPS